MSMTVQRCYNKAFKLHEQFNSMYCWDKHCRFQLYDVLPQCDHSLLIYLGGGNLICLVIWLKINIIIIITQVAVGKSTSPFSPVTLSNSHVCNSKVPTCVTTQLLCY
jgi:hypothetical protein